MEEIKMRIQTHKNNIIKLTEQFRNINDNNDEITVINNIKTENEILSSLIEFQNNFEKKIIKTEIINLEEKKTLNINIYNIIINL